MCKGPEARTVRSDLTVFEGQEEAIATGTGRGWEVCGAGSCRPFKDDRIQPNGSEVSSGGWQTLGECLLCASGQALQQPCGEWLVGGPVGDHQVIQAGEGDGLSQAGGHASGRRGLNSEVFRHGL